MIKNVHHYCALAVVVFLSLSACDFGNSPQSKDSESQVKKGPVDSISYFNEVLLKNPNDADSYIDRARQHLELLDFKLGLEDVERAIGLEPKVAGHYFWKGRIFYQTGRLGDAKFALEKAIELDASHTGAKLEMAEVYHVLTNYDRSMELINDALRVDDQLVKAYFLKGLIYKETKAVDLAKSSFQTVTELDPESVEAYNLLGMLYAEDSDSLALVYYSSALGLDSTHREVLYNRAYFYQVNNNPEAAIEAYDLMLDKYPDIAVAHHNKGYVYLGLLDEPAKAIDSFTEAIRYNRAYVQAYANRGVAHEELGEREAAIQDYQFALELEPNLPVAMDGLNRLH